MGLGCYICIPSAERQKDLGTSHLHTQLDPFAVKLTVCYPWCSARGTCFFKFVCVLVFAFFNVNRFKFYVCLTGCRARNYVWFGWMGGRVGVP